MHSGFQHNRRREWKLGLPEIPEFRGRRRELELGLPEIPEFRGRESSQEKKMIVLQSSDGQSFEIEEEVVVLLSQTIKTMIENGANTSSSSTTTTIPLPRVSSEILTLVIEYCKRRHGEEVDYPYHRWHKYCDCDDCEDIRKLDANLMMDGVDDKTLRGLTMAAHYLNIKCLLELGCQTMADRLKGKSIEETRAMFGVTPDLTPEEEAEIRREHAWVFDDDE